MRRFATILSIAAMLVLLGSTRQAMAQSIMEKVPMVPYLFMFESVEDDTSFFNANYLQDNAEFGRSGISSFQWDALGENDADYGTSPAQGDSAGVLAWLMYADANSSGYGGSSGVGHVIPDTVDVTGEAFFAQVPLYDISDFTELRIDYNVLQAATYEGMVLRVKLHDASEGVGTAGGETENWSFQPGDMFNPLDPAATTNAWNTIEMPLESRGLASPNEQGFGLPGCTAGVTGNDTAGCWSGINGNQELDLDVIGGVTFEFFANTSLPSSSPDSTSQGVIVFDNFRATGVRYDLISGFEAAGDVGGWDNGDGSSTRTIVQDDTVQGTAALELDYNVVGSLDWGGSADVQINGTFVDMSDRGGMSIFYKVTEPLSGTGSANLTFKLYDDTSGEEWHYTPSDVLTDSSGVWRRIVLPFDAFAIPSWMGPTGEEVLDVTAISDMQVQVGVGSGADVAGTILFDRLTSYGEALVIDEVPPAAVEGFMVDAHPTTDYANLVQWTDVPEEEAEVYNIYYSFEPINPEAGTDDLLLAAANVPEGTEVYEHRIFSAVTDQDVAYYYAIRAVDASGNDGPLVVTDSAVETMAMGIPTIAMNTPESFAADGDLSEWSGITPFSLDADGEGLGHAPDETGDELPLGIDGPSDLSYEAYFAVDSEALYFAFDVTDDEYVPVPDDATGSRWLYDGGEIYIGLYNETSPRHLGAMSSGNERDYKIYVYQQTAMTDGQGEILTPGENYYFQAKEDGSGYVVEARMPLAELIPEDAPAFEPEEGMRIPFDFVVMDNDEPGSVNREGILAYSFWNNDNAHGNPRNWFYTWIGNQMRTGVERVGEAIPSRFALHQNYPNPFNPSTLIKYELPRATDVSLRVFNIIGQEVMTLVDASQAAGEYEVTFDASQLSSGLYFYQIKAGDFVQSKKMILVK